MLLYAEHISSRLRYVVDFVSKELFYEPIKITHDLVAFLDSRGPKINYSHESLNDDEFWVKPVHLLFETGITTQHIECFRHNKHIAFFKTSEGDMPFDIFAAIFFLLSRYEEYLPAEKDVYGRFAHESSLAFQHQFLNIPVINYWVKDLRQALLLKFPDLYFTYMRFKFIPTYDIDRAYAFVDEGWKNEAVIFAQSLLKGKWSRIRERRAVLAGTRKDPFDAYEWLDALHLYCRLKPHYFFLLAGEPSAHDPNINPSHPQLEQLIEYYASGYKVGIHPSWQSAENEQLLKEEIEWLEYLANRKIIHSRQHQLRLSLPGTYRRLIKYGIEKDHSMGYPMINGFRASVASSFYWYDLEREETTSLLIFPFCFSDTTALYLEKLNAQEAFEELMRLFNTIKAVNGLMITVWHNQLLGPEPVVAGWKEVYEIFLKDEVYWEG